MFKIKSHNSLLLLFLISISLTSIGQPPPPPQFGDPLNLNIIPPSPEAAELGRYGEHPVSLFTGLPSISVPIWNLQSRKLSTSVSLSYHASGIKVSEAAPFTGLRWNLNAGGAITRTVRGLPDESAKGYFKYEWGDNNLPQKFINLDPAGADDFNLLKNIAEKSVDGEPDIYYYNVQGLSGSFVFDAFGDAHTMSYQNIEIRRTDADNRQFIIIAPDGTTYRFGLSLDGTEAFEETDIHKDHTPAFKSTWYLTDIITPFNEDTISFEYETGAGNAQYSYLQYETQRYGLSESQEPPCPTILESVKKTYADAVVINPRLYLKTIKAANGSVKFETSAGREDHLSTERKLDKIIVEDAQGNDIRTFEFEYGYFNDDKTNDKHFWKRLRLDAIHEQDSTGGSKTGDKPLYTFDYYDHGKGFPRLPRKDSYDQDHWGYYNHALNNKTLVPAYENYGGIDFDGADREPSDNDNHLIVGTIKRINYPTGGYSEFEFEPHNYKNILDEVKRTGGLRIKKLTTHDGLSKNNNIVKTYEYLNSLGETSGRLVGTELDQESYKYYAYNATPTGSGGYDICDFFVRSAISKVALGSGGSPVGYTHVTEYLGDKSSNSGKTVSYFRFVADNPGGGFPFRPSQSMEWQRGQLTRQVVYANEYNDYYPRSETINNYTFYGAGNDPNVHTIAGLTVGTKTTGINFLQGGAYNDQAYEPDYYQYMTGWAFLHQSIQRTFDEDDPNEYTETISNFEYDNPKHALVTEVENVQSDGSSLITQFSYPHDFNYECDLEYDCDKLYFEECYADLTACNEQRESECESLYLAYVTLVDQYNYLREIGHQECYKWWLGGGYSVPCGIGVENWYNEMWDQFIRPAHKEWEKCINKGQYLNSEPCRAFFDNCLSLNSCESDVYEQCIKDNLAIANDERTSIIFDLQKKNISTAQIEQRQYVKEPLGSPELIHSRFYEYKNYNNIIGTADSMIQLHKVWQKYTTTPTTAFTIASINQTDKKFKVDTDYETIAVFNQYDQYGHPVEFQKEGDALKSFDYSYNGALPVAGIVGANAHVNEILGGGFGYVGFESNADITDISEYGYWRLNSNNTMNPDAHTGEESRKLDLKQFGPSKTFAPDDQDVKYVFSAWIKTENGYLADKGTLNIVTLKSDAGVNDTLPYPLNVSGTAIEVKFSSTNGEWQYVEGMIDIPQIRLDGSVPANEKLHVFCQVYNNDSTHYFLIDDIRFRPLGSSMSTHTYDPLIGKTSSTGNNNIPAHYEYDSFGRLHLSKNHNKDITGRINYDYDVYSTDPATFNLVATLTGDYKYDFVVEGTTNSNYRYRWSVYEDADEFTTVSNSTDYTYPAMTFEHTVNVVIEDGSGIEIGWDSVKVIAHKVGGNNEPCNEMDEILVDFDKGTHVATLTATDVPNANYVWNFGEGGSSSGTDNEVTHTYNTSGTYDISVHTFVEKATCISTGKVQVTIIP
jgi:hypothetical protein